ncbi:unnamed protein product, partial [Tuber aestivum]
MLKEQGNLYSSMTSHPALIWWVKSLPVPMLKRDSSWRWRLG